MDVLGSQVEEVVEEPAQRADNRPLTTDYLPSPGLPPSHKAPADKTA
jgi:hypothetical protein